MNKKNSIKSYWFIIEPYVYVGLSSNFVVLYNTLDGVSIESSNDKVVSLVQENLRKSNNGVTLLSHKMLQEEDITEFIYKLRDNFMGDIIDSTLSNGKPVQLHPIFNYSDFSDLQLYKRQNFSSDRNLSDILSEITVHMDMSISIDELIPFLLLLPPHVTINLSFENRTSDIAIIDNLLPLLRSRTSAKNMICSYKHIAYLPKENGSDFSYNIVIDFPINQHLLQDCIDFLFNNNLQYKFIFKVASECDYRAAESIIENYRLVDYVIQPVFNAENIDFFEQYVFLSKDDILSMPISLKDIFMHQSINSYDFGKFSISSDGDIYANEHFPPIGNICSDSLSDLIEKEIKEGESWLRIRNQYPCTNCAFQWLCPSPSNYELEIGRPNLCSCNQI